MQPRRPDSAKSRVTQKTLDTQLNQSKFSQTFTSYTTFKSQKKDEFLKYLQQKDKDPKFRKYQQTNLPEISQKPAKQQLSKINSKPFEKRSTKIVSKPKIQQQKQSQNQQRTIKVGNDSISNMINSNSNKGNTNQQQQQLLTSSPKWTITQPQNNNRKQAPTSKQMNLTSKSFAEKNKQKMSSTVKGMKKLQIQVQEKKKVEKRIQFKGFKVNQPGAKREVNNTKGDSNNNISKQQQVQNEFLMQSSQISQISQVSQISSMSQMSQVQKEQLIIKKKQQQQKQQQQKQQLNERQQQLLQISRFINQVQQRNVQNYPQGYEEFVQMNNNNHSQFGNVSGNKGNVKGKGNNNSYQNSNQNDSNNMQDSRMQFMLDKIDINKFLVQPTQSDYMKVQRRIKENQKILLTEQKQSEQVSKDKYVSASRLTQNSSLTIDLDNVIDGDNNNNINSSQYHQQQRQKLQQQQEDNDNTIFLSQISSHQLKQRNLFLTEILKGRVTKQQINKLQQMNRSQLKLHKLQHINNNQGSYNEQDIEINMIKRQSNRLLQRNIIQASGQIYRDCDYLSQENKLRLQRLLNGDMDDSPFIVSEWEQFAIRRIDQGIRLYRGFSNNIGDTNLLQSTDNSTGIMPPQQLLPKDPTLRKQAQRKILKQKLSSINNRLQQIQNIVITKSKIQQLINQYQHLAPSQLTQSLINQRNNQIQQIQQKSIKAMEMLTKAQQQKGQIEEALKEMQQQFLLYQKQCKQYQKLTVQQIVNKQKQQIKNKKQLIEEIQKDLEDIEKGTQQTINDFHQQLQKQILRLKEIENVGLLDNGNNDEDMLLVSRAGMTVEELDQMFEKRVKEQVRDNSVLNDGDGKRLIKKEDSNMNVQQQQGKQDEPVD